MTEYELKEFLKIYKSAEDNAVKKCEKVLMDKTLDFAKPMKDLSAQLAGYTKSLNLSLEKLQSQRDRWKSEGCVRWYGKLRGIELSNEDVERIVAKISEE